MNADYANKSLVYGASMGVVPSKLTSPFRLEVLFKFFATNIGVMTVVSSVEVELRS